MAQTSIVLTNLIRDYTPNENYIAGQIFPTVTVSGSPLKAKTFGKDMFKVYKTLRAKYGKANVAFSEEHNEITVDLKNHELAYILDKDNTATEDVQDMRRRNAKKAKEGIDLRREVDVAAKVNDSSLYPAGHKITLAGTDQWSDPDNSDPIKDVFDGKQVVASKIGKEPNLLVLPKNVYNKLIFHSQFIITALTGQKQPATLEVLKAKFDIKEIAVGDAVKLDESDNSFGQIWTKNVQLLYINPNKKPNKEDVSFSYCFREKGFPKADEYESDDKNNQFQRAKDKYSDEILGVEAGYLIIDAIA